MAETEEELSGGQTEARDLCRTLLQANPRMSFKELRESADNLGLKVSRWLYSAVQRELAGTVDAASQLASTSLAQEPAESEEVTEAGAESSPALSGTAQLKDDRNLKSPVMTFTVHYLREHPNAPFKEVRNAAETAGLTLYPISYGRAQALLGIVKAKPRRAAGRGRAIPPKPRALVQGAPQPSGEVESFLDQAHAMSAERDRYRKALQALRKVLRRALELDD